jgi:glycosyltransferase involved in cell wall biosynthesis
MEVILLGFTLPDEDMDPILNADPAMPAQTHRFSWAVVRALEEAGCRVELWSTAPVATYPANPRVWFGGGRFAAGSTSGVRLPFINLVGIKHATRALSAIALVMRTKPGRWNRPILVHGINTALLAAAVFSRRLYGGRIVCLLTDPPAQRPSWESTWVSSLRVVDRRVIRALLSRFDGVVALTPALAEFLAPGIPSLVMEGIAEPATTAPRTWTRDPHTPRVVYAGGLSSEYGTHALVEAAGLCTTAVEVRLYGKGELPSLEGAPVTIGGFLAPGLVETTLLDEADYLINPRPTDGWFVPYSFPSKVMQYLGLGIPVISTRLSGFPEGYDDYLIWAEDSSPAGLARALESALTLDAQSRRELGEAARDFVAREKSPKAQGRRIVQFLRGLEGDAAA